MWALKWKRKQFLLKSQTKTLSRDNRDLRQLGVGRTKLIREMMIQEWDQLEGHCTNSRKEGKAQKHRLGMWPLPVKMQA